MDRMKKVVDEKVVYFAHPITHYNTDVEWECMEVIITMLNPVGEDPTDGGISIMNPNQRWLSNIYKNRKDEGHENAFGIFEEIVKACDITVGCTFFDGSLGAGVTKEMKMAIDKEKEVYLIYIDNGKKLFLPTSRSSLDNLKTLSIEETRLRIAGGQM